MIDCDFIPSDYRQAYCVQRAIRKRSALVGVLCMLMAVWFAAHRSRLATANAMLMESTNAQRQVKDHLAKKQIMEVTRSKLVANNDLFDALQSNASVVLVLAELSRKMPTSALITKMQINTPHLARYAVKEVSASAKKPKPAANGAVNPADVPIPIEDPVVPELSLTMIAGSVAEVARCVAALESSPLLARVQVDMKQPSIWASRRVEQFVVTCDFVPQKGGAK